MTSSESRSALKRLYERAIVAAQPAPAVTALLARDPYGPGRIHIIATGKASATMAGAAVASLAGAGRAPAGGIVVSATRWVDPPPGIRSCVGDHPVPGPRSLAAAGAVGEIAALVAPADDVVVLVSGGTSSLIAAPVSGLEPADVAQLAALLLGSGLEIGTANRIRRRVLRWGGGRLAAALAPARVRCLVLSDVMGNDPALIGSGPCSPDDLAADEVAGILEESGLWLRLSPALQTFFSRQGPGCVMPREGDPVFARVTIDVVGDNTLLTTGALATAAEIGIELQFDPAPLAGPAAAAGEDCARALLTLDRPATGIVRGGETTVALGASSGLGGRCQELALAAARVLRGRPNVMLLAAGSDGRDGPTDAAGAVVDGETWDRIAAAGRDPAIDLGRHDAYYALAAVDALLPATDTGTNVCDIVIGLRR